MIEVEETAKGVRHWFRESIVVKLIFIGMLILLLLIPSAMIDSLITERAARQEGIIQEVSDKWSAAQQVQGPVLIIPYKRQVNEKDAAKKDVIKEVVENLYILPDNLNIKAAVNSSVLHRGIFDVVVYSTGVKVQGNFIKPDLAKLSLTSNQLMLDKARLSFSISDLKGLKTNPIVTVAGNTLTAEPIFNNGSAFTTGLQVGFNLSPVTGESIPFNFNLDLKGSEELSFLALGKTTDVEASGDWNNPSFDGRSLPDKRTVDKTGFSAHWKMLYYNRPFPQQWVTDDTLLHNQKNLDEVTFGVKLRIPVDEYQKTTRTSKYGVLIIFLTFISLFLTELIRKQRIHIFNYVLIGAAMIIFYTLLLSFSEQVGYNYAYLIAAAATIGLITLFMASLFKNRRAAAVFAGILSLFYSFIFVIIQLEDLSLLVGSIALFIVIATLMYFSRKINWDLH